MLHPLKLDQEKTLNSTLPALSVQILELAKAHGRVTTQGIVQATGESLGTIKVRLVQFVSDRLLVRYGKGQSTWYRLS